jgi:DNA invertase Pin-like site-specific DNA recombinase
LARNNADWHRLLELAALTCTLILDEDGVYDPANFNDRLLLGKHPISIVLRRSARRKSSRQSNSLNAG